jgi:hypothetical protein
MRMTMSTGAVPARCGREAALPAGREPRSNLVPCKLARKGRQPKLANVGMVQNCSIIVPFPSFNGWNNSLTHCEDCLGNQVPDQK